MDKTEISLEKHKITILFGSQTGTAQYVSQQIQRFLVSNHIRVFRCALDAYDVTLLPDEQIVIFVVSTTGQGETPYNMKNFWSFLLIEELPTDSLKSIKFCVFGLGDSAYIQFNATARQLYQRLLQLGAQNFIQRALADEQHPLGFQAVLSSWLEVFSKKFFLEFPNSSFLINKNSNILEESKERLPATQYLIQRNIQPVNQEPFINMKTQIGAAEFSNADNIQGIIKINECLTPKEYQRETRNIIIETKDQLNYLPGDTLLIHQGNDQQLVKNLINYLELNENEIIQIIKNPAYSSANKLAFPEVITIQELFQYWLDLTTPPSRFFLRTLSQHCSDPLHQQKLEQLGSSSTQEGIISYFQYVVRQRRNIYEILFDFNSVKLPLENLIDSVQLMRPREYSISTSCQRDSSLVGITVGVVKYKTQLQREILGLCSSFLAQIQPGEEIHIRFQEGQMRIPKELTHPLIMIGPGTGVAPFISMIQERNFLIQKSQLEGTITDQNNILEQNILFFGSRHQKQQFYYRELLQGLDEIGRIKLFTAFSRDSGEKCYVQHLISKNITLLGDLIQNNIKEVKIFICGTSQFMPQQVSEAIITVISKRVTGDSVEQAKELFQSLESNHQLIIEAW